MKKTIAIILTILMAASTFTACSQANGVAESSVDGSPETAVSTVDETVESTQKATSACKTVIAETSPVSGKTEPSTTEPSKPKKTATSKNSGNVAQNYGNDGERSASSQTSQNEAPVQQQKAESKAEEKPQAPQKPKTESTPKTTDKPKTQSKPQTEEKTVVKEQPKQQSIDLGRVTSTLISYGCSLGMVYNGSLNTGNAGWFPPLDVSGYAEEWIDPVVSRTDLPTPKQNELMSDALNVITTAGLEEDRRHTVYSVAISEKEFMRFNLDNDGSPGTMVALLLSRAIAKLFPESENAIRIALCVNQRKALNAPLAHQSLVGGVMLEYKDKLRDWSLEMQGTAYRGMVFAQTQEENVLRGIASFKGVNGMLLTKESDQERIGVASYINSLAGKLTTATVSYVGKADYKEAEQYIRDFRLWTSPMGNNLLVEISAVNGRFTLDFLQSFSSPVIVNAFLKELDENGIIYDLQDVNELELPNIKLPWTE